MLKIATLFLLLLSGSLKSQTVQILKDSVLFESNYYVLEEVKFNTGNQHTVAIYGEIQNAFDIFNKPSFETPEKRIQAKKDTLLELISNNELRQANYGFEQYKIFYDKNQLLNFSVHLQSYGSPFEATRYYCFDLNTGKNIGSQLFINHTALLKCIKSRLKKQNGKLQPSLKALQDFKITTDSKNKITGISFMVADSENYRNSGYEQFEVVFTWKEIQKYIAPSFKKRII